MRAAQVSSTRTRRSSLASPEMRHGVGVPGSTPADVYVGLDVTGRLGCGTPADVYVGGVIGRPPRKGNRLRWSLVLGRMLPLVLTAILAGTCRSPHPASGHIPIMRPLSLVGNVRKLGCGV